MSEGYTPAMRIDRLARRMLSMKLATARAFDRDNMREFSASIDQVRSAMKKFSPEERDAIDARMREMVGN